jgi:hypothetical protein
MILAGFAPGRAFPALPFAILLSRPKQQIGQSDGWRFTMPGVSSCCFWTAICPAFDAVVDDEQFWLGLKSKPPPRLARRLL